MNNIDVNMTAQEKVRANGKFKPYQTTNYRTVREMFEVSTKRFSSRIAILEKRDIEKPFTEYTYNDFGEAVSSLGSALISLDGIKDKPVIIIGETSYHWYISYMALLCGAGIAVPTDKELPENEFSNIVNRSEATAVIYSPRSGKLISNIKKLCPSVKYTIEMYCDSPLDENGHVGFDYLLESGRTMLAEGNTDFKNIKIDPDEFRVLVFTSGTTAASKGVMLSNRNIIQNANACRAYVKFSPDDRLMSVLPLHHTYESSIGFITPIAIGCSIGICPSLKQLMKSFGELKPSVILAVPLLLEKIYKKIIQQFEKNHLLTVLKMMRASSNGLKKINIDVRKNMFKALYRSFGGNLKYFVCAAAPLNPTVANFFSDTGITMLQGYGLTETAPIAAMTPDSFNKVGSAGMPVHCSDLKILNPNENGEGEIMIKSDTLMLGYYKDPEATENVITPDGWFHSGDIGYIDDDGFLFITGRCKNVIVTQNGKNIYPEELEMMLYNTIPEISECMVYGKEEKDDLRVAVKVIPDYQRIKEIHGENLDEKDIFDIILKGIHEINGKISKYKAITVLEIKKDGFEKTTTMKIKRAAEMSKSENEQTEQNN